jgi:hypothetical protein
MERTEYTPEVLDATEQAFIVREAPAAKKVVKRRIGFFTGEERHSISLGEGSEFTRNYRKSAGKDAILGGYFGKQIFERILAQQECVGIRVYFAKHAEGNPTFVLTGADTIGNDLYQGILAQETRLSPPWFANPNALNSDTWKKAQPVKRSKEIFTGNENHYVTLAEASQLTRNYRISMKEGEAKGAYFGGDIFRKILTQLGCVGVRIYFGMHDDGTQTFVLVGVDEYGFDLISGTIGQMAMLCPPWCAVVNPLNK